MAKKKVFVSYDYDNDKNYKNLLLAWDANSNFEFGFNDRSTDVSVNSNTAAVIRRVISSRIGNSTYFLCIIGKSTYRSSWVTWEINKAVELKKKIVAVKINQSFTSPPAILNVGASWAMSYSFASIKNAIDNA